MDTKYEIPAKKDYQEICRLEKMLSDADIPHVLDRHFDGWHIYYPGKSGRVICSVIEFTGSFGYRQDKLEIQGLLNKEERKYDSVVGYLSAENVFDRIKADWERRKKRDSKMESRIAQV